MTTARTEAPNDASDAAARPDGEDQRDLSKGSIQGHIAALAIPAAVGMAFNTLYNIVDVWFAGQVGTEAQAGLAIAGTVFFLLLALGFGVGSGVNALIGNALGAGERSRAAALAAQGLTFAAMAALLVTVLGYAFTPTLLDWLGAEGGYRKAALDYLRVVLLASPSFLMAYAANGVCASQGDTKSFQRALTASFFANCLLNPLFVWGLDLGLVGIAWATVAAQTGVAGYMIRRAIRSPVMASCGLAGHVPRGELQVAVAQQALPASFNMLTILIGAFLIQVWLVPFGEAAVAGYGVALRIEQIVLLPGFGITGALLPLVAQNNGAGLADRVRESLRRSLMLGCGLMVAAAVLITVAGRAVLGVFTDDPAVIEMGWSYLAFARWMLPAYFALFAFTAFLQGIKRPLWPVWIGVYRQLFAITAFGWLFTRVLDIGVTGVWWAILAAVVSGLLLAVAVSARVGRSVLAKT